MSINNTLPIPLTSVPPASARISLNNLPRDVLNYMLAFTDLTPNLSLVCKTWRSLTNEIKAKKSLSNLSETGKLAQNLYVNYKKLKHDAIKVKVETLLNCLSSKPGSEVLNFIFKMALEWKKLDKSEPLNPSGKVSHDLAKLHFNAPNTPKTVQLALATLTSLSNPLQDCALSSEPAYAGPLAKGNFDPAKLTIATHEMIQHVHISSQNTFEINEIVIIQLNHLSFRTKEFVFGKILAKNGETYEVQVKAGVEQFASSIMIGKLIVNMRT